MSVKFEWSRVYEENIHLPEGLNYNCEKTESEIRLFIGEVSSEWDKVEAKVINYIEKLTNLKFSSKNITCYVVHTSKYLPISNPLTIPRSVKISDNIFTLSRERFIDMLIHELIHILFVQNEKALDLYFSNILCKKYTNLNWNVRLHIPLHAIQEQVFLKFFDKLRLENEIEASSYFPDYKKAWDIVKKDGAVNIISDLKKSLI